ncbi:hypothetical protein ANCCAN_10631 [Ancylostoma caninum]|uniref:Uncharacterized protein n=1 Tax=Ancylostoma caninum TaxID=29170 RepID=A0A368GKF8_ANCCA|nr:hypothetical protein ANCCAN_10631 [Ancylostoma caninum]
MVGDSYLCLATDKELKKLITAASVDGQYHEDLFSISEVNEIVVLIVVTGHIVFQIHIPKGTESGLSSTLIAPQILNDDKHENLT